jgi:hypothetical protein
MLQKLYDMFPINTMDKIEISDSPDTLEFMTQVAMADVILPLVDRDVFYDTYQGGNKLTSSVTWGLGFHKKMILYRPLADAFGIMEDNVTYFLHGDGESEFSDAFGRCLYHLLGT